MLSVPELLLLGLSLAGTGLAGPVRKADNPCADVAAAWLDGKPKNPDSLFEVDGQLAFDCLHSVPLQKDKALQLTKAIVPFWEAQSTLAFLKNPPPDYQFEAVDILGRLAQLTADLEADKYNNEYDFLADLFRIPQAAHDGHFYYIGDLIGYVFSFRRNVQLVSVSMDGVSPPKIYDLADIQAYVKNKASPSPEPPSVRQIDGKDATKVIEDMSLKGFFVDRDALYNRMFWSPAASFDFGGDWGGWLDNSTPYWGAIWPGASTNITFENGTTLIKRTTARVIGNLTDITNGSSIYARFCTGNSIPPADSGKARIPAPVPQVYSEPTASSKDKDIMGFYLDDSDVAVLAPINFVPADPVDYQKMVETFLADAVKAGKTKLILDLSQNRGGNPALATDLFRQLFPTIVQDDLQTVRSTKTVQILAQQFSGAIPDGFDPVKDDDGLRGWMYWRYWNYRVDLNISRQPFDSLDAKFKPQPFNGDNFTPLSRGDFNASLWKDYYGIEISGYGTRSALKQPFKEEDVLVMFDGACNSACGQLALYLRMQTKVRSVTLGGRPGLDREGRVPLIQQFGGNRAGGSYSFTDMYYDAKYVLDMHARGPSNATAPYVPLSDADRGVLESYRGKDSGEYADYRNSLSGINWLHSVNRDLMDKGIPDQFVNLPTDCRLFYTPESILDPREQWKHVAKAGWGNGTCVAGSLASATK